MKKHALRIILSILCVLLAATFTLVSCKEATTVEEEATTVEEEAATVEEEAESVDVEKELTNLEKSLAVDISGLLATDGQPLLDPKRIEGTVTVVPARPDDPEALPETDSGHWFDYEYAQFDVEKINLPESPGDGAIGKKVIAIWAGDHPYVTSQQMGMEQIAEAYQIDLKNLNPNWDPNLQAQLVEEAIVDKPDFILLEPIDAVGAVDWCRKINEAGIPVIIFTVNAEREAYKYAMSYTGPDNWAQFRILARAFADEMNKQGGYAILRHTPGQGEHFSRTWGPITELATYAPDMKVLDMVHPGFDVDGTKQVVSDWITRFGDELNGLIVAVDQFQTQGAIEACIQADRLDIVIVAAGNSQMGMDNIKNGYLFAETYQSAQSDGALPLKIACDWFNGMEIKDVYILPIAIINQENVDDFMPGQW